MNVIPLAYEHDGITFNGQLATPEGDDPRPAIMVMHDARGLGEFAMRRIRLLASMGYVAFGADMYGGGFYDSDATKGGDIMLALHEEPERLRARVLAGYAALKAAPRVDTGRIAAIGFCFGGQCVLELARSGADVRAVASYHGLLTTALPARPGSIKAQIAVFTGGKDPYAPIEDVDALRDEMTAAGASWHLSIHSEALHAFTDPDASTMTNIPGVGYDALADHLSWASTVALLQATIG